jgi:hypothetical protein
MTAKAVKSHRTRKEKVMKALRVLLLVLALSVSANAGWMECGRAGEIPNDKASTTDLQTEIALYLLSALTPF